MRLRNRLCLPVNVPGAVARYVGHYGTADVETGAFLLAPADKADEVDVVAFAGMEGITRRRDVFGVSGRAIERLFGWAEDHAMRVRALVHSHERRAFLSDTDLGHGFAVRGFTTAIVPWYASPPTDPTRWGWWRYEAGNWQAIEPATVAHREAEYATFDEGGVYER